MFRLIVTHSRCLPKRFRQITCSAGSAAKTPDTPNNATQDNSKPEKHPDAEKDPLPSWPDGINPRTGERGGPAGPEPTRYGDWERKGRVSDF